MFLKIEVGEGVVFKLPTPIKLFHSGENNSITREVVDTDGFKLKILSEKVVGIETPDGVVIPYHAIVAFSVGE